MRRVLFISYYFPPEPGGGVQRSAKFVKYLPQFGWTPTVITIDRPLHAESDRSLLDDVKDADVVRTKASALPAALMRRRPVRAALDRVLVPDSQITWRPEARRAIRDACRTRTFDAVYTTCKPFSAAALGLEVKRERRLPWVLDFRDLWIENPRFRSDAPTPLHRRAHERAERAALEGCDYFLATSPSSLRRVIDRMPRLRDRADWIPNGFDPDDFAAPPPPPRGPGPLRIVYTGACYPPYSPEPSFAMLRAWSLRHGRAFEIHYAGLHEEAFARAAARSGVDACLVRHGHLDHAASIALMRGADVLLLFLPAIDEARGWVPGKVYEYLAAGPPIFCVAAAGDAAAIVEEAGAGAAVDPDRLEAGVAALQAMTSSVRTPRADVIDRFNRRAQAGRLAAILERVTSLMETSC